ncbi:MAG: hypothetical protein LBB36_03025, partial [Fibromonadaceae bacterium]|nr:hypothetical protein [Fibromonadaceae bacterium]
MFRHVIPHLGRCGGTGSMGEAYANRPCRGVSGKRLLFAALLGSPCGFIFAMLGCPAAGGCSGGETAPFYNSQKLTRRVSD